MPSFEDRVKQVQTTNNYSTPLQSSNLSVSTTNNTDALQEIINRSPRLASLFSYNQPASKSFEDRMNSFTPEQRNMFNIQNNSFFPASEANYDPRFPKYFRGIDNNELYAETEPWYKSLGKGLTQLVSKTAINLGEGVGLMGSLLAGIVGLNDSNISKYRKSPSNPEGLNWGASVIAGAMDNSLVNWFESQRDYLTEELLPIYNTAKDQNSGFFKRMFTDKEFWTNDFTDGAAFLLSAVTGTMALNKLATGAKVTRGLNSLVKGGTVESEALTGALTGASDVVGTYTNINKMSRISSLVSQAKLARNIDVGVASFYNTGVEALHEGIGVRNEILRELNSNPAYAHLTQQQKNNIAGQAAVNDAVMNLPILAFSNLWEINLLTKRLPSVSDDLSKAFFNTGKVFGGEDLVKLGLIDKLGPVGKELAKGIWWEGFWEENMQLAAQRLNIQYGLNAAANHPDQKPYDPSILEVIGQGGKQAINALTGDDPEASLSMGLGGLLGTMFGGASSIKGALKREKGLQQVKDNLATPVSAYMGAVKDKYVYEETGETDKDGNPIKRIKLDNNNKPILNMERVLKTLQEMRDVYELTDLFHATKDSTLLQPLNQVIEDELFGRMAYSYFQNGLGNLFVDKFSLSPDAIKDEDMQLMGLDPTQKGDIKSKLDFLKAKAISLQNSYDTIQRNIIPGSNSKEAIAINERRKAELFRLENRISSLNNLYQSQAIRPNNLADQLRDKEINLERAKEFKDKMQVLYQINKNKNHSYYYHQAIDELKNIQEDLNKFNKDNKDLLPEAIKQSEERDKNLSPIERGEIKKQRIKAAEIYLAMNSAIERRNRIASSEKYFTQYEGKEIPKTRTGKNIIEKPILTNDTSLENYNEYEDTNLRSKKIENRLDAIDKETRAEELEVLPKGSQEEVDSYIAKLKDNNNLLDANALKYNQDKAKELLNERIDNILLSLGYTRNQYDNLINNIQDYQITLEFPDSYSEDEVEEAQKRLDDYEKINNLISSIEEEKNTIDSLKSINSYEESDNSIKRSLADEYINDSDKFVSDYGLSNEGFDTSQDLNEASSYISQLSTLQRLYRSKKDILSTKEFKGFEKTLEDRLEKLKKIEKEIREKISDRDLEDYRSQTNTLYDSLSSLGINPVNNDKEELFNFLESTVGKSFPKEFNEIVNQLESETTNENIHNKIISIKVFKALVNLYKDNSSVEERDAFNNRLQDIIDKSASSIIEDEVIKNYKGTEEGRNLPSLLKNSPNKAISIISDILVLPFKKQNLYDVIFNTPEGKLKNDLNLYKLLVNLDKFNRGSIKGATEIFNKEEIKSLAKKLIRYKGLIELKNISNLNIESEINNELTLVKDVVVTPSEQQLNLIRSVISFINTYKENRMFSTFGYIKGEAGSGKTAVVAKWISRLSGYNLDNVLASGPTENSAKELSTSLGVKDFASINDVKKALTTSPDNVSMVILDEVGRISGNDLAEIGELIYKINSSREGNKQIHVLLLGDPNQINQSGSDIIDRPDIERVNLDGNSNSLAVKNFNNISVFNPLTIKYRSNIIEINNLTSKFYNNSNDLREEEIISQSNILSLDNTPTTSLGVFGTNSFDKDLITYLKNQDFKEDKKRLVIVSPKDVQRYKDMLFSNGISDTNVEVSSYLDAQGRTLDEVYVNIAYDPSIGTYGRTMAVYNKIMYMSLSRATNFVLVGGFKITNNFSANLTTEQKDQKEKLEASKSRFTANRDNELQTYKELIKDIKQKITSVSSSPVINSIDTQSTSSKTKIDTTHNESITPEEELIPVIDPEAKDPLYEEPQDEIEDKENDIIHNEGDDVIIDSTNIPDGDPNKIDNLDGIIPTEDEVEDDYFETGDTGINDNSSISSDKFKSEEDIENSGNVREVLDELRVRDPSRKIVSFKFPSNTSTKVMVEVGNKVRFFSRKALRRISSMLTGQNYAQQDEGLKEGDQVEFFVFNGTEGGKDSLMVYIAKKTPNGQYRQVAILQSEEVENIQDPDLNKAIQRAKENLNRLPVPPIVNKYGKDLLQDIEGSFLEQQKNDPNLIPPRIATRTVYEANQLGFLYKISGDKVALDEDYQSYQPDINHPDNTLSKIIKQIFPEGESSSNWPTKTVNKKTKKYTLKELLEKINERSKIIVLTGNQIENLKSTLEDDLVLLPGVPYLRIENGIPQKNSNTLSSKDLWIKLDRQPLNINNPEHVQYLSSIRRFFALRQEITNLLKFGFVIGDKSYPGLMTAMGITEPYGSEQEHVGESVRLNKDLINIGRGEINWLLHKIVKESRLNPEKKVFTYTYKDFPKSFRNIIPKEAGSIADMVGRGFHLDLTAFPEAIKQIQELIELTEIPSGSDTSKTKIGHIVEGEVTLPQGEMRLYVPTEIYEENPDKFEGFSKITLDKGKANEREAYVKVLENLTSDWDKAVSENPILNQFKKVVSDKVGEDFKVSLVHEDLFKGDKYIKWKDYSSDYQSVPLSISITDSNTTKVGPAQFVLNEIFRAHVKSLDSVGIPVRVVKGTGYQKISMMAPKLIPNSKDSFVDKTDSNNRYQRFNLDMLEHLFSPSEDGTLSSVIYEEDNESNPRTIRFYHPLPSLRNPVERHLPSTGETYVFPKLAFGNNSANNSKELTNLPYLLRENFLQINPTNISFITGSPVTFTNEEKTQGETNIRPDTNNQTIEQQQSEPNTQTEIVQPVSEVQNLEIINSWREKIEREDIVKSMEYEVLLENFKNSPEEDNNQALENLDKFLTKAKSYDPEFSEEDLISKLEVLSPTEILNELKDNEDKLFFTENTSFHTSSKLTLDEIYKTMKRLIPSLDMKDIQSKIKMIGEADWFKSNLSNNQWGYFKNGIIYLRDENNDNSAKQVVVLHEIAHMIYDNYLTNKEREVLKNEYLAQNPNQTYVNKGHQQRMVEEWLADQLSLSEPVNKSKTLFQRIIDKIKRLLNFVFSEIDSLDDYINAFHSGRLGSRLVSDSQRIERFIKNSLKDNTISKDC